MAGRSKAGLPPAERILGAAADLLRTDGIDAVSTRAVAAAAGVQPPAIYRLFGDKDGLLDAVASDVLQGYMKEKRLLAGQADSSEDPVVQLRRLWDLHIEFGLNEPDCYVLVFGSARPGRMFSSTIEAVGILSTVIGRLGAQGRLRMSVERATTYFRSTGTGFILSQMGAPPSERDPELSSILFEDTMAAMTNDVKPRRSRAATAMAGHAIALREALRDRKDLPLTAAERTLLGEWLNRLADSR